MSRLPNGFVKIKDFPNYLINKQGEVYSRHRKKIIGYNELGYRRVDLRRSDGDKKIRVSRFIHRLVYETFKGEIPEGFEINHKNSFRDDNRIKNLEAITPIENIYHRELNRNGKK